MRRSQTGSASVELAGVLPLLVFVALAAWQLLLLAFCATEAQEAARTGSRAAGLGRGDGAAAAVASVSPWLRDDATARNVGATRIVVRIRVPVLLPGFTSEDLTVTRTAELPGG